MSVLLGLSLAACGASVGTTDGGSDAGSDVQNPPPDVTSSACTFPSGRRCAVGTSCPADDGCNTCVCAADLSLSCTERGCPMVDASAPDVPVSTDAGRGCNASNACPPDRECVFAAGCGMTSGTCEPIRDCDEPNNFCGCDGVTFTECRPHRPFFRAGECDPGDGGAMVWRHRGAILNVQAPGGFAGTGPAVTIDGDGILRVYFSTPGFDPAAPSSMGDRSRALTAIQTNDVFDRLAMVPTAGLPHPAPGGGDCYPTIYARACASCPVTRIDYSFPSQVLPEFEPIFAWFDSVLRADEASARPRSYCVF